MPSKNNQVYVSQFPRRATSEDLKELFDEFGKIKEVYMKRGYAFIEFEDPKDAEEAVEKMNRKDYEGRELVVEIAGKRSRSRERRRPKSDDICNKCGETGHWAYQCRGRRRSRSGSREKKCYNCGRRGHIKRFCPNSSRSASSRSSRSSSRSSRSYSKSRKDRKSKKKHSKRDRSRSRSESKKRSKKTKSKRDRSRSSSRSRTPSKERNGRKKSVSRSRS